MIRFFMKKYAFFFIYFFDKFKKFFIIIVSNYLDKNFLNFIIKFIFKILMISQSNKVLNTNITKLVNKTYQYGFSTNIEKDIIEKGLSEKTIQLISKKKKETNFLLEFRLKGYKKWKQMSEPEWAYLKFPQIDYQDIIYYSAPKSQKKLKDLTFLKKPF